MSLFVALSAIALSLLVLPIATPRPSPGTTPRSLVVFFISHDQSLPPLQPRPSCSSDVSQHSASLCYLLLPSCGHWPLLQHLLCGVTLLFICCLATLIEWQPLFWLQHLACLCYPLLQAVVPTSFDTFPCGLTTFSTLH